MFLSFVHDIFIPRETLQANLMYTNNFSSQVMTIKNMTFKVGQTLTVVGVVKPDSKE